LSNSIDYYIKLCEKAMKVVKEVPASHKTLFIPTQETKKYFKELYLDQINGTSVAKKRPGDETCGYCEKFHINNLKNIDKDADISIGKDLENCFKLFLEEMLNGKNIYISIQRADSENLHMPDFKVVRTSDGKILAYFEFKAIYRPFIKISDKVDSTYECYSHSLTLDLSNGKKLMEQRKLVEDKIGTDNVYYVYWYDLPCIKGIFWISSKRVYEHMDKQVPYERRIVEGDFSQNGKKKRSN
jgi:hypothetical protein